jgi:hypothetical protein
MGESSYWDRFWRRKVSRRRLLRGPPWGLVAWQRLP